MKRLLAMLLSVVLVLGVFGAGAMANKEPETAPVVSETLTGTNALAFGDMKERILSGNPSMLAVGANIEMIERIDYKVLEEDMRDALNATVAQQAMSQAASGMSALANPANYGVAMLTGTMMEMSLSQQYEACKESYESILDGEMQKDNADLVRQLKNTQNTVVMVGETLYVTLLGLDLSEGALTRQEQALERTLTELTLRRELGQISDLTLRQAENGALQLASGKASLEAGRAELERQLNALTGAPITAEISLETLPEVTAQQLAAIDVEKDLERAKAASYELYAAKKTLEEEDEAWQDIWERYGHNLYKETHYEYVQGELTWEAAQHTYRATVENFELAFRNLCTKVGDYAQVLEAAKAALRLEESNETLAKLKYERGMISRNAYLEACDTLETAREKVTSAKYDLFTAYNNYRWAVDEGLLNG